jgi:L-type amino acid transporter 9
MDVKNTAGKLKKELGVFGIFSYIFGGTVGSGIFVSPIFIFQTVKSGGVALSVWIVAGIIAILGGVSYCELGGLVKNSGGEYTYILKGFSFRGRKPFHIIGPLLAFSAVWTYAMLLRPASFSVVMLTFAEYACKPFFGDHVEVPSYLTKLVAMLFMICLGILNCYSQKETVRVMNLLTVTKFGALLMIMIIGAIWIFSGKAYMLGPSLANGFTSDIGSIFISLYSAFWAYEGWTGAAYMVEEVKDVTWLPLVTGVSIFVTGFCYCMVVIAYMAALDPSDLSSIAGQAIALPFAKKTMGSVGVMIIPLMVALSTIGAANATLFAATRYHMFAVLSMWLLHLPHYARVDLHMCVPCILYTVEILYLHVTVIQPSILSLV